MEFMIDLETMGVTPNCPVISIGAVAFNSTGIKAEFEINLDLKEQIDSGKRICSADTIGWWIGQFSDAKRVFKFDAVPVRIALEKLCVFIVNNDSGDTRFVWGNGSYFDISIMEDLFRQYGLHIPWSFLNVMDLRTYKRFFPSAFGFKGTEHNALDDARYQALCVINGMKSAEGKV